MRTAPENKYTDRDVREDPKLKELAIAYVRTYGGEFDPLVRAQNMLEADCDLTTAMTRIVLNCMRVDAHIASSLPAPRGYYVQASIQRATPAPAVKAERRPVIVHPRLHGDYWMNFHRQARWFHKIDHSATTGIYYPAGWLAWDHPFKTDTLRLIGVRGVCGKQLIRGGGEPHGDIELMDLNEAWRAARECGVEYCPRCKAGKRDAGGKP